MNKTQSYTDDLFDFPFDEPSKWPEAISHGSAATIHENAYKVAHLLLYGMKHHQRPDHPEGMITTTSPRRLTPERQAGLLAVVGARPEIGLHVLTEAICHPDQTAIVTAVLPGVSDDPADWYRVVEALLRNPQDEHLVSWLAQRDWDQADLDHIEDVMMAFVSANRVDLMTTHRALWEDQPRLVDRCLDLALPATSQAVTDRPALVQLLVSAQPSEKALVLAWTRLGKSETSDSPAWHHVAQLLPPEPLAQVTFSKDFCWMSHEGTPLDTPIVADRLGRYATPDFQATLLERFPGQMPMVQARVRQRQSFSAHEPSQRRAARCRQRS